MKTVSDNFFFFSEAVGHTVKMFWTESAKMSYSHRLYIKGYSPCAVALGQKHNNGHVWYTTPVWAMTGAELDSFQRCVMLKLIYLNLYLSFSGSL